MKLDENELEENTPTKFKEYTDVKTLVKKGNVEIGEIGYIIDILDYPCEGYVVEFSKKGDYKPWALEIYDPSELEEAIK